MALISAQVSSLPSLQDIGPATTLTGLFQQDIGPATTLGMRGYPQSLSLPTLEKMGVSSLVVGNHASPPSRSASPPTEYEPTPHIESAPYALSPSNNRPPLSGGVDVSKIPESAMVAAISKLEDLEPLSTESLQRVLIDTLLAHNLPDTAAALRQEPLLAGTALALSDNIQHKRLVPTGMPDSVAIQYKHACDVDGRQKRFVNECSEKVVDHRCRLEKLIDQVHELRVEYASPTPEQVRANFHLKQQEAQLEELRDSRHTLENMDINAKEDLGHQEQEQARLQEAIALREQNLMQLQVHRVRLEETLEHMGRQLESSEFGQAQRIRHILLHWDAPNGPKRVASETFAHVDCDHDGRLDWHADEVCRFVRLLFHYNHVEVPDWPEGVWFELFRCCELDKLNPIDVTDALKFARGCFEACLRSSVGG